MTEENGSRSGTAIDPAIGLRILALRRAKGWKQEELVREAGLSIGVISRLERGRQSVSAERLYDIARALNVTPDVLHGIRPADRGNDV